MTKTLLSHSVFSMKPWLDFSKKWQKWAKKKRLLTRMQNKNKSWICLCLAGKTILLKITMQERSKIMVYYSGILRGPISLYRFLVQMLIDNRFLFSMPMGSWNKALLLFPSHFAWCMYWPANLHGETRKNCDLTTTKKSRRKIVKNIDNAWKKTPLLVKFLNHNFFYSPRTITKKLVPLLVRKTDINF